MELRIALQPKQREFMDAIEEHDVVFFGGARGSGKSYALRNIHLIRRLKYPGSVGVIFRESYKELDSNHIRPLLTEYPELREYYREGKKMLQFPESLGGGTQLFRHCGSPLDAANYQGEEWHDFSFEEAGNLKEDLFEMLRASNRSSNPNIPAKCQLTGNPAGAGHKWLKRRFVEGNLTEAEAKESYAFIPATLDDNLALKENDPGYERRILSMGSEMLIRAWRWGDWDIEAGQYFSELREDIHYVEPFDVPEHWNVFAGFDYGWSHPAALVIDAVDEQSNLYRIEEFAAANKSIEELAELFWKMKYADRVTHIHAGHDCWTDKGSAFKVADNAVAPTIAEEFQKHKMFLVPANIARVQGAHYMRERLHWKKTEDGKDFIIKPSAYIFRNCPLSWKQLVDRVHDPDKIEDVLKEDAKHGNPETGDDVYDATRYSWMSRFGKAVKKPNPRDEWSIMSRGEQRASWRTA